MAYNLKLASRVRELLTDIPNVEEKVMFRGLAFLVNGKMCVNVSGEELMCRFDPSMQEEIVAKKGTRLMEMKGKVYKGYVYVSPEVLKTKKELSYWINLTFAFNKHARKSKK